MKQILRLIVLVPFLLSVGLHHSLKAQCVNPEPEAFFTECGSELLLCINAEQLTENRYADVHLFDESLFGLFKSCDIGLPDESDSDVIFAEFGTLTRIQDTLSGECFIRYSLFPEIVLEPFTVFSDSFDYFAMIRDTCNIPSGYCDGNAGKIWTINAAYYGPAGASVVVSNLRNTFDVIHDLQPGQDFFVDGRNLPAGTSEWIFTFYEDENLTGEPICSAMVNTSCEEEVFGVDFGCFRPVSGCVALTPDAASCPGEGEVANENVVFGAYQDTIRVNIEFVVPAPLPIEFSSFTGHAEGNANRIEWAIESIINEEKMILQRSENGYAFKDIKGYYDLKTGRFDFLDQSLEVARNYYRFKMVSTEGEISFSRTITVNNPNLSGKGILIYPNPVSAALHFSSEKIMVRVQIFSITGELKYDQAHYNQNITLNIAGFDWGPGIYLTAIHLENRVIVHEKISIIP